MLSASKSGSAVSSGYNLTNSLRIRNSASAYLSRSYSTSATNSNIQTISVWTKRGSLGIIPVLFMGYSNSSNYCYYTFNNDDTLWFYYYVGGVAYVLKTTQVFRDPSAWYHFVFAYDSTQATASNRVKLYVNGSQITSFSSASYPPQNSNSYLYTSSGQTSSIGAYNGTSNWYDGYFAEINFIDGQALTPSSFGSFNSVTGVWQPAKYTGTYGTNGFYLPFSLNTNSTYAGSFNGSNQYLSTTATGFNPSTGTWTLEGWAYCNTSGGNDSILIGKASGSDKFYIDFSGTTLYVGDGTINNLTITSAKPVGSWFHWALVKNGSTYTMYINGSSIGSTTTSLSSNAITVWNIGARTSSSTYLNGYMSNVRINTTTAVYTSNFTPPTAPLTAISGTQLLTLQNATIVDNSTNAYTITNNGSVTTLVASPFSPNTLGTDASGNGNNWTTNNISLAPGSTYDSMTDVPTLTSATVANYCVLNPLGGATTSLGLANGNLYFNWSGNSNINGFATFYMPSGKFYIECQEIGSSDPANLITGFATQAFGQPATTSLVTDSGYFGYTYAGRSWNFGSNTNGNPTLTVGTDVLNYAIDITNGKAWVGKNGTWFGSGNPATGANPWWTFTAGTAYTFAMAIYNANGWVNFGQQPWSNTPPSGFVALNAYNLPTSTILAGNKYMDATLYTGDGTSGRTITNASGFQPDLVWIKSRSNALNNNWYDSNRGAPLELCSNLTAAESSGDLTAFASNGFTINQTAGYEINHSGYTYVGWQWQAGKGTTSSNTNGSITSTVSVNATAGFSVVTYAGPSGGSTNQTVGHGLGVAPAFVVVKNRVSAFNWDIYHQSLGYNASLTFTTSATRSGAFSANPSSTLVYVTPGYTYNGNDNYVMYCWAQIPGFSAFGSYTGNGSASGPFVYCGFQPKFILIKSTSSGRDWIIWDTARNTYNIGTAGVLFPDTSGAEYSGSGAYAVAVTSNGFYLPVSTTNLNASGETHIYAAFATNPFRNSLAF